MPLANPYMPVSEAELMRAQGVTHPFTADLASAYAAAAAKPSPDGVPSLPADYINLLRKEQGVTGPPPAPPSPAAATSDPPLGPSAAFRPPTPPSPAAKAEYQAHALVHLEWVDPAGVEHNETQPIRILNRDDMTAIAIMAGQVVALQGGNFDDLPITDQAVIRAIATAEYMWPKMSAALRSHVHNDDNFALDVAAAVARHRSTYFRYIDREGNPTPRKSTVRLVPGSPPGPAPK